MALGILVTANACSAASTSTAPASPGSTARSRITDAADARRQLDELEREGECLELQSDYLAIRTMPVALASELTEAKLDEFRRPVADLRPKMPEAMRPDYDTAAKAYEGVITQLDGLDLSDQSKVEQNAPRVREALAALDDPKVKAAESRLDAYFRTCTGQP